MYYMLRHPLPPRDRQEKYVYNVRTRYAHLGCQSKKHGQFAVLNQDAKTNYIDFFFFKLQEIKMMKTKEENHSFVSLFRLYWKPIDVRIIRDFLFFWFYICQSKRFISYSPLP